jgi:hypothetical protein
MFLTNLVEVHQQIKNNLDKVEYQISKKLLIIDPSDVLLKEK